MCYLLNKSKTMDLKTKLKDQLNSVVNDSIVNNETVQKIIANSFLWMWIITTIVFAVWYYMVYLVKTSSIDSNSYFIAFIASIIIGFVLVIVISWFYEKFNYTTLAILALLFAVSEWVGISWILASYSATDVINAFAAAAALFIIMAIYWYTTKSDLTKFGTILLVGLIALIIVEVINIFIGSSQLGMILSWIWILLFMWLVAWNLQVLKLMAASGDRRFEIVFGLSLYLDFINIFLEILKMLRYSSED